jgi:arylsulfatase A-like enzyme
MVDCLDENVGKVVAALDKKGLRDNTLILFHSDNGGTVDKRFTGQMADVSNINLPCDNGPYRGGKGSLFEGACRVAACANWPGRIQPQTVNGVIHAVDIYPTLAALAGASTAKCKPLDGVNVWDTIAEGKASPRSEFIYNVEPFRGSVRQGDWKLIWRTVLPTNVELYNLAADPYEKHNVAAAHPDKVAAMQSRLETAGEESAQPLALLYIMQTGLKSDVPLLPTDEGFYTDADDDPTPPKFGNAH